MVESCKSSGEIETDFPRSSDCFSDGRIVEEEGFKGEKDEVRRRVWRRDCL